MSSATHAGDGRSAPRRARRRNRSFDGDPAFDRVDWESEDPAFRRIVRRVEGRARAEEQVRVLGLGYLVLNALGLGFAGLAFLLIAPWGLLSGDPTATFVLGTLGTIVAGAIATLSLPGLLAGFGLLRRRPWARTLALGLSVLALFSVPFGTVLGVLSLYILLQDDVRAVFESAAR